MACKNCMFKANELKPFNRRKIGIEEKVLTPDDIVLKGVLGTEEAIVDDKGCLFPKLPSKFYKVWEKLLCIETNTRYPQPFVDDFHGYATICFDGYLENDCYKLTSEEDLHAYVFTGMTHLVGCEHPYKDEDAQLERLYYLAADFDLELTMLAVPTQIRISPKLVMVD